jgi:saccharopine dehydrogenase-like NADP-dependent oxidoreductase
MGYAFNWSPEGVVNQYLNDCEVISGGSRKWISPLEGYETVVIDGTQFEAFTTSGGVGTICESFVGRVKNLDYKTIRYPGHMQAMEFFFHELLMSENRELAAQILTNAKPPVSDDVVYIHVASEGHIDGQLARLEYVRAFKPREIAGQMRTAIAWTTAGSVVSTIEMVSAGLVAQQGFLKQEDIPLADFLSTSAGSLYTVDG